MELLGICRADCLVETVCQIILSDGLMEIRRKWLTLITIAALSPENLKLHKAFCSWTMSRWPLPRFPRYNFEPQRQLVRFHFIM